MVGDGRRIDAQVPDVAVRTRDDDIQQTTGRVGWWVHVLNQGERFQDAVQCDAVPTLQILQVNIEITQDDQLGVECGQGFQDGDELTEEGSIWGWDSGQ